MVNCDLLTFKNSGMNIRVKSLPGVIANLAWNKGALYDRNSLNNTKKLPGKISDEIEIWSEIYF